VFLPSWNTSDKTAALLRVVGAVQASFAVGVYTRFPRELQYKDWGSGAIQETGGLGEGSNERNLFNDSLGHSISYNLVGRIGLTAFGKPVGVIGLNSKLCGLLFLVIVEALAMEAEQ
jgi:hypothetical protein